MEWFMVDGIHVHTHDSHNVYHSMSIDYGRVLRPVDLKEQA
jgi:hypothetical protein